MVLRLCNVREYHGTTKNIITKQVYHALGGQQAINIVKKLWEEHQICFKLILMDCHMDDMDGFEASKKILTYCDEQGIIPPPLICAQTGDIDVEIDEKCLKAGMKRVLAKPLE